MKFFAIAAAAASLLTVSAQAQDVPGGTYNLDPTHTTVVFGVSHVGFSLYRGTLNDVSGSLSWDAADPTKSSLTVSIGADSVHSPAAVSHADNANFQEDIAKLALGSETQDTITFTSTTLRRTGEDKGVMVGELSFNGQTHPIEMVVELTGAGEFFGSPRLGFSGEATIDRTQWGSDAWTQFGVGTEVVIEVEAEFGLAQ